MIPLYYLHYIRNERTIHLINHSNLDHFVEFQNYETLLLDKYDPLGEDTFLLILQLFSTLDTLIQHVLFLHYHHLNHELIMLELLIEEKVYNLFLSKHRYRNVHEHFDHDLID